VRPLFACCTSGLPTPNRKTINSKRREQLIIDAKTLNKALVGRWFASFWGDSCDLAIVDELAAPDVLLHYSMQHPRRGHLSVKSFMADFREAFSDLRFRRVGALVVTGDVRHRGTLSESAGLCRKVGFLLRSTNHIPLIS
jgi:SnoaL-like polyketide cyclase